MQVFVLRDSKGYILERNSNIGPLFDSSVFIEATTGEKTSITAESLDAVLLEMKQSTT